MEFKDKVVVITGGSKGIGRGIALAFAAQGARVAISARGQDALDNAAAEIEQAGGQALAVGCDVTNQADVDKLAASVLDKFGAPDILVNNAGIAGSHKFATHPDELWHQIIDVNLTGVYRVAKAFTAPMIANGGGRIINMASVASKVALSYMAAYTAAKHGVLGLTRALAVELNPKHITVNAVCPGFVDTPMTVGTIDNMVAKTKMSAEQAHDFLSNLSPQKRLLEVEEVVLVTLMLAAENARGITGQAINVDGGMAMF